jgi:hypothetical protein
MPVRRLRTWLLALAVASTSTTARADPTKDECNNANESAQGLRASGKLRDARDKLTLCLAKSCPGPVRDDCTERLNELQRALPTVVFAVRSVGGDDLSAVRVKMDGVLLAANLDGSAIAVDPGQHRFTFEARGFAPFDEPLLIREGERERHERVMLRVDTAVTPAAAPPAPAESPATAGSPPTAQPPTQASEAPPSEVSTTRVLSFVALGLGVAGVAVGSIFGVMAMGDKSSLNSHCSGDGCPPSEQSDINGLHSNGWASNIGFGVGIVGLAAGAVVFLVSRSGDSARTGGAAPAAPWIGLGGSGVRGSFE